MRGVSWAQILAKIQTLQNLLGSKATLTGFSAFAGADEEENGGQEGRVGDDGYFEG